MRAAGAVASVGLGGSTTTVVELFTDVSLPANVLRRNPAFGKAHACTQAGGRECTDILLHVGLNLLADLYSPHYACAMIYSPTLSNRSSDKCSLASADCIILCVGSAVLPCGMVLAAQSLWANARGTYIAALCLCLAP